MYFPTVQELIAGRGVSGGHAPNAIEKPALDDDDRSINSNKSMLDFHTNSTKSTAGCLESRQTSLNTTISSSSKPQNSEVDCKVSKAAELCERVSGSLKRKTRSIWGEDLGKLSIL